MKTPEASSQDYKTVCIGGIEVFVFGHALPPEAPVVFITHGREGCIQDVFPFSMALARKGLLTAAIEQRNHGRKTVDASQNRGWTRESPVNIYGIMMGTVSDISLLIDFLPAKLARNPAAFGITGASLGGHVTLLAMANEPRISAGAALIASGDFRHVCEMRAKTMPGKARPVSRQLEKCITRFDPVHNAKSFADRPLLLASGGDDKIVPPECARLVLDAVSPFYTRPDRLEFREYPGVRHEVPAVMMKDAVAWLSKWLHLPPQDTKISDANPKILT